MSKSKKAVFLKEWTQEVGKTMNEFHEGAALMVRKHQKSSIKNTTFASTLHVMGQREHSPVVKSAIETLNVELTAGEEHRSHTLAQLQANVVAQFDKYAEKLKVQDENIRARNEAFATFVKKQKAFVAAKATANPTKQSQARALFEHEHKRLQSAEQTLNTAIVAFEHQRVSDMKSMLAKFISSQMYFYTRQLEGLSRAYAEVVAIDPNVEAEKWGDEMRKLEQMEMEQGDISALLTQAAQEQHTDPNNPANNQPNAQPAPPADHSHLNASQKIDPYAFNQTNHQQPYQPANNQAPNIQQHDLNSTGPQQFQSTLPANQYQANNPYNQPNNQSFNQTSNSAYNPPNGSPYNQQAPYNQYNQQNNPSQQNNQGLRSTSPYSPNPGPTNAYNQPNNSYNQPNNQQLNPQGNQQFNQAGNSPYNQPNNQSFNQPNNQSFNPSYNLNQSLRQPMTQSSPFNNTANYANYMNPQPKLNPYSNNQTNNQPQRGGWQESKQQM